MLVMCHRHLQVWNTQAKVFADCFADAGLIGLSALIFLIGQAWPCRTSSDPKVTCSYLTMATKKCNLGLSI